MDHEEVNEKLKQHIKFTTEDLHLNKQGMLTPSQIETLKVNDAYNGSKTGKLILGIAFGGFVLGIYREGFDVISLNFILPFLGMFALMYFGYAFYNKNNLKKLTEGRVKVDKIEGIINLSHDEKIASGAVAGQYAGVVKTANNFAGIDYGNYAYILEIGGKKIMTSKAISEAFVNGKNYKVYFVRPSKTEYRNILHGAIVVSAEPL